MIDIAQKNDGHHRYQLPSDPLPSDEALKSIPCSVCYIVSADNENHVLYCDGKDCLRAYHQQCLDPPLPTKVVAKWPKGLPW